VLRPLALLAATVLHGVLVASALAVLDGLGGHERWDWGHVAERATMFAVVLGATIALQKPAQRFFGSGNPRMRRRRPADRAVRRAVWDGVLPTDVDPAEWRQQVASWLREAQAFRVFYAVGALVVAALVALTAVRVDDGDRGVLALAAVLAAAAPAVLIASRGAFRRARQLRDGHLTVG